MVLSTAFRSRYVKPRFLLVAGLAESLLNFRGPLIKALQGRNLEVHVAAPDLPLGCALRGQLESMGLRVHDLRLARTGTNPLGDAITLWALWRLMRRARPDFVLAYTIKPVVYGSIAAWLARVPHRFALITGLGYSFQDDVVPGLLTAIVHRLYSFALARVHLAFFQNPDDKELFSRRRILRAKTQATVVNGSGIDVDRFSIAPQPEGAAHFLLIARLIGAKGVREYALAAARIRASNPEVRFTLVGWIDESRDAIRQEELDRWVGSETLQYLGRLSDVRAAIERCSVFVLPSAYREGTPRTILEAMAMGRAIITTDAPGCRETVVHGDNGFLIPTKSVDSLESAMRQFIDDPLLAARMGTRSRRLAEEKYDVRKVNAAMLREMRLGD